MISVLSPVSTVGVLWDGSASTLADVQHVWPEAVAVGTSLVIASIPAPIPAGTWVVRDESGTRIMAPADVEAAWDVRAAPPGKPRPPR